MACETTKEVIILPVNTVGTIRKSKFYVIKEDMRYNALFGRPWAHNMKVVPSTSLKTLKFPTLGGIKTVNREQPAAKEIFAVNEVIPVPVLSTLKNTELIKKEETK